MIKIKTVLGILVAVLAIGIAAYFIGSKFYNTPDQNTTEVSASEKTPETQTNQTKVDTEKTPSLWSRVVAFVLLGLILIVVIVSAYKEKRGVEQKIPWKDIMLQPVLISVLGLLILNPLASLFAYNAWLWFWDHNILFWGTNMGIPILVHLLVKQHTRDGITKLMRRLLTSFVIYFDKKYRRRGCSQNSGKTRAPEKQKRTEFSHYEKGSALCNCRQPVLILNKRPLHRQYSSAP